MEKKVELEFLDIEEDKEYEGFIQKVIDKCFEIEKIEQLKLYISVTLTNPKNIKEINKTYRNIEKETDVLSFPMFEKKEIEELKNTQMEFSEVLGDIIISVDRVKQQAEEYGHSFERELAYMLVHGFYHLMGEDHIEEADRMVMREKEEKVLSSLQITRD